jgi:prolyl-tRNA synthetase
MRIEHIFGARHRRHESDDLLQQAGYIRQHASGIYSYLTLGLRSLRRIEAIVRDEMDRVGAQEILMSVVHDADVWKATGRYDAIDDTLLRLRDRTGRDLVLGMTHEEVVAQLAASEIQSYRGAGVVVYQIQTKFRDEARSRRGLLRTREFLMKDAYSLHLDERGLEEAYADQMEAYRRIFHRVGLRDTWVVRSATGDMGGRVAHEFMTLLDAGEDTVLLCRACGTGVNAELAGGGVEGAIEAGEVAGGAVACQCGGARAVHRAVEVGNIFQLGTRYSEALGAYVDGADGRRHALVMGSYGIGISRLLATLVEQGRDEAGIRLHRDVAALDAHVVDLARDGTAEAVHRELAAAGLVTVLDDRDARAGEKLADADLLGASFQVIVGRRYRETGELEVRRRWEGDRFFTSRDGLAERL